MLLNIFVDQKTQLRTVWKWQDSLIISGVITATHFTRTKSATKIHTQSAEIIL